MSEEMKAFNQRVIDEFRENEGKVGPPFEGAPMMLLGTVGAKSGEPRTNPLVYTNDGDHIVIVASFAGSDRHPPWFYNLKASGEVIVEVGTEKYTARAVIVDEPERTRLYSQMESEMATFTEYREKTERVIPVIRLERV